jgi:hypothetical protein
MHSCNDHVVRAFPRLQIVCFQVVRFQVVGFQVIGFFLPSVLLWSRRRRENQT